MIKRYFNRLIDWIMANCFKVYQVQQPPALTNSNYQILNPDGSVLCNVEVTE